MREVPRAGRRHVLDVTGKVPWPYIPILPDDGGRHEGLGSRVADSCAEGDMRRVSRATRLSRLCDSVARTARRLGRQGHARAVGWSAWAFGRYFGSPRVEPHPEWFVGDIYGGPNDGVTLIWHRGGYSESDGTERMFVVAKIGGVPCITKDGRAWVGRWEVAECPRTW
jgi:hypothetical protein